MASGWKPCDRLERKRDLLMCLALHMENSPQCGESEEFHRTGIVVCESDSVQSVVSMWCSSKDLHAIERVMLSGRRTLRNCSIYLSRKPCSTCTKFVIQVGISSVYYWPRHPELKDPVKDLEEVDQLFLRSSTVSSPFIPLIDHDTDMKKIAEKTHRFKCGECKSKPYYKEMFKKEDLEKNCELLNLQCKDKMKIAFGHLDTLLQCYHGEFEETDMKKIEIKSDIDQHTHALQLCFLLAARSDDPQRGIGCLLYEKDGYFFGAGYNGYPIGALYGNLPRNDRGEDKKKEALIHAETNTLLFRNKENIEGTDICYCSKFPCENCEKFLKSVGIKKIITMKEEKSRSLEGMEVIQWTPRSSRSSTVCSLRLREKRDLCIFLALLMEFSPSNNGNPSQRKTGIVICEGSKFQRIIAVDTSTEKLHAVQKVTLMRPKSLRGCHVYLSRKPCIECVKFLVQAQVSHIYFWSNLEEEKGKRKEEIKKLHRLSYSILRESRIYSSMFTPVLNLERANEIVSQKTRTEGSCDKKLSSELEEGDKKSIEEKLEIFDLFLKQEKSLQRFQKEIQNAKDSFKKLVGAKDCVLMENNFKGDPVKMAATEDYMLHSLQVCNVLAARSDTYSKGVGAVICKDKKIVDVGYKGYPRGTINNLFVKKVVKEDDELEHSSVICAEENALLLRSEGDLNGAELFTTEKPCPRCELLIRQAGIKRIIWPVREKVNNEEQSATDQTRDLAE